MKKFLLVAALAFVTMGASANNGVKKASFNREKKAVQVSNTVVKNLSGVTAALKAIDPKNVKENYSANVTRADGEITLIPAYSEWTYHYESDLGFLPQIMYSGASYLVKDGKAYLQPFANLGMVEGVVEKDVTNALSEDGADSITFSVAKIASYKGDSTTVDLFLEPCYIENYAPHRLNQKTFGAYYFAEANELYIPRSITLALFTSDEAATDPFSTKYVARQLDLLPQADYQENMSKATFTATSYYGTDNDWSGDAQAYVGDGYFYIKGISNADEEAWIEFDATKEDATVYELVQDQWINTYRFYTDATHQESYRGVVATVGLLQADGKLTGFNKAADYSSFFKMTDNLADETSTLENTDNTVYGEYIYGETDDQGGMYNAANMKINILYEPVPDGIQSVGVESSAKFQNAIYNMAGQRVGKNFKGLVIKNGKKVVVK